MSKYFDRQTFNWFFFLFFFGKTLKYRLSNHRWLHKKFQKTYILVTFKMNCIDVDLKEMKIFLNNC